MNLTLLSISHPLRLGLPARAQSAHPLCQGSCTPLPPCPAQSLCVTALLDGTGKAGEDRSRLQETKAMLALPEGTPAAAPGFILRLPEETRAGGVMVLGQPKGRGCPFLSLSPCVPTACDPDGSLRAEAEALCAGPSGDKARVRAGGGPGSQRKVCAKQVAPGQQPEQPRGPRQTHRTRLLEPLSKQAMSGPAAPACRPAWLLGITAPWACLSWLVSVFLGGRKPFRCGDRVLLPVSLP